MAAKKPPAKAPAKGSGGKTASRSKTANSGAKQTPVKKAPEDELVYWVPPKGKARMIRRGDISA